VEWLRSCYVSNWRFYGDPAVLTQGRYYFSPRGAPHFPAPHYFGSSVWTNGERLEEPPLGEVTARRRTYSKGGLPVPFPPPVLLGTLDCLAGPEAAPSPRATVGGIDVRCYLAGGVPIPPPPPPAALGLSQGVVAGVGLEAPAAVGQVQSVSAYPPHMQGSLIRQAHGVAVEVALGGEAPVRQAQLVQAIRTG
jgi:hypothetical protein